MAAAAKTNGKPREQTFVPSSTAGDDFDDGSERPILLKHLRPWAQNPRKFFDDAEQEDLARSIRALGVVSPLLVRPIDIDDNGARYEIADGERRFRAAPMAGLSSVPCKVRKLNDEQMLEIAIVSFVQRKDLKTLEKSAAFHSLIKDHGQTIAQISNRIGCSKSHVQNMLRLVNLPDFCVKASLAGNLPDSVAYWIARIPGLQTRDHAARCVLAGQHYMSRTPPPITDGSQCLSARETRAFIERYCMIELGKNCAFPRTELNLVEGVGSCDDCPKRAGNLKAAKVEGYEGVRNDMCTDPDCYGKKAEAWKKSRIELARAGGQQVLSAEQSAALFAENRVVFQHAPYFGLDEPCYEALGTKAKIDEKPPSFRQLLGTIDPKQIVVAETKDGELRELISKDVAAPILRRTHGLYQPGKTSIARLGQTMAEKRREEEERRRQLEIDQEAKARILALAAKEAATLFAAAGASSSRAAQVLRCIVETMLHAISLNELQAICERRHFKGTGYAARERLEAWMKEAAAGDVMGLAAEILAGRFCASLATRIPLGRQLAAALKLPDYAEIEREVRAARKSKGRKER